MKQIRAEHVKQRLVQLAGAIRCAPVLLVEGGRKIGVILSLEQFEALRGNAWKRLCRRPHLGDGDEEERPAPG